MKFIHPITSLPLGSQHRVSQITFHPHQPYVAFQSHDKSIEVFRIRNEEEIKKKMARRKKRKQEKAGKKGAEVAEMDVDQESDEAPFIDKLTPHVVVRASGKVRSFDFSVDGVGQKSVAQLFVALSNNALEIYSIPQPVKSSEAPPEATRSHSVHLPGHRADVRSLCLTSDDRLLASAANGSLKIWNMKTTACIRTMDCPNPVCTTFLPGDRHIAVGTKTGDILVYDVSSSSLIETVKAHTGTVWSLHVRRDGRALVSGSADKDVKFWEFEEKEGNEEFVSAPNLIW